MQVCQLIWKVANPVVFDEILKCPCGRNKILLISQRKTLLEDQVGNLRSLGLSTIALHNEQGRVQGHVTCPVIGLPLALPGE